MLLAYLAMHPKQTHLRDKLATLLWDDAPAEQARLSLRQTLFAIRQALPSDPMLLDGDSVAVAVETVTVDVTEFEQVARSHDPDDLERAAALTAEPSAARATSSSSVRYTTALTPARVSATNALRFSLSSKATTRGGRLNSMHPKITATPLAKPRRIVV